VWAVLITTLSYLPGLLTLHYSLQIKHRSKHPLVALYTPSTFPESGLAPLRARGIPYQAVTPLQPVIGSGGGVDPRFALNWTKLVVFSLTQYSRLAHLDADMLVLGNMDELLDNDALLLHRGGEKGGEGKGDEDEDEIALAAAHACTCNPRGFAHYPRDWTRETCAYTRLEKELQQLLDDGQAESSSTNLEREGELNGGLLVLRPSERTWSAICTYLTNTSTSASTSTSPNQTTTTKISSKLPFADQSLLSDLFRGRWRVLPWVYNALKTMRWPGVHDRLWRGENDGKVKCVHYILTPKPWQEENHDDVGDSRKRETTHQWWMDVDLERRRWERENGVPSDGW
ncbi:glycosyltransferase family 8 protein, partial [Canariomyces notabilis]